MRSSPKVSAEGVKHLRRAEAADRGQDEPLRRPLRSVHYEVSDTSAADTSAGERVRRTASTPSSSGPVSQLLEPLRSVHYEVSHYEVSDTSAADTSAAGHLLGRLRG